MMKLSGRKSNDARIIVQVVILAAQARHKMKWSNVKP
jgi:hypothetical protein